MGYRRACGKPGARNDLWVIPTAAALCGEAKAILRDYHKPYWIDSLKIFEHGLSYFDEGGDWGLAARILAGLALNPNAAGVLLIGLGDEGLRVDAIERQLLEEDCMSRVRSLVLRGGVPSDAPRLLDELASDAPRMREEFQLSDLCVGFRLGTDGYSSLAAGRLIEDFSDFLDSRGGTVLISGAPDDGTPRDDFLSCTCLAGGGAQVVFLTTGRGTPLCSVVPTSKISTDARVAEKYPDWTDADVAGLTSAGPSEIGEDAMTSLILRVASGEAVAHERRGVAGISLP
jgi:altronate dehydratase